MRSRKPRECLRPTSEAILKPPHPRATLALTAAIAATCLTGSQPGPDGRPAPAQAPDGAPVAELLAERAETLQPSRAHRGTITPPPPPVVVAPPPPPPSPPPPPPPAAPARSRVDLVVGYALAQVGERYVWGAAGPNTWDCSGLTMRAYAQVGVRLGHWTGSQIRAGRPVSRAQIRRGDLVFTTRGHVGIALDGRRMVAAANPRDGVEVSSIYSFYAARRLL